DTPASDPAADLAGYLGPDSVTWRLAGEAIMLLGGGRAVLLQLAHPLVAAGVGQHSSYRTDPWGRTARTIELMAALTYGTRPQPPRRRPPHHPPASRRPRRPRPPRRRLRTGNPLPRPRPRAVALGLGHPGRYHPAYVSNVRRPPQRRRRQPLLPGVARL